MEPRLMDSAQTTVHHRLIPFSTPAVWIDRNVQKRCRAGDDGASNGNLSATRGANVAG